MKKFTLSFGILLFVILSSQAQIVITDFMYNPPESGTILSAGTTNFNVDTPLHRKTYPNPFDREITYKGKTIARIQILDVSGKIVYDNNQINAKKFVIKNACFRPGLYFVKAFDSQGKILTQKIITNK